MRKLACDRDPQNMGMASNEEISAVEYCFLFILELLNSLLLALLVEPVLFLPKTEKKIELKVFKSKFLRGLFIINH